jgi:hypothetical protein
MRTIRTKESNMKSSKFLLALVAAGSLIGGAAMAQATDPKFSGEGAPGAGNPHPELGPRTYSEYAGNSGWKPSDASPLAGGTPNNPRTYGRWFDGERQARNLRDRDGDGVPDRYDRYPNSRHYR